MHVACNMNNRPDCCKIEEYFFVALWNILQMQKTWCVSEKCCLPLLCLLIMSPNHKHLPTVEPCDWWKHVCNFNPRAIPAKVACLTTALTKRISPEQITVSTPSRSTEHLMVQICHGHLQWLLSGNHMLQLKLLCYPWNIRREYTTVKSVQQLSSPTAIPQVLTLDSVMCMVASSESFSDFSNSALFQQPSSVHCLWSQAMKPLYVFFFLDSWLIFTRLLNRLIFTHIFGPTAFLRHSLLWIHVDLHLAFCMCWAWYCCRY